MTDSSDYIGELEGGDKLKSCPFCGEPAATVERDGKVFQGQYYTDAYPEPVASQNHGFRVRCECCGCQTCWWHYMGEALHFWNSRTWAPPEEVEELRRDERICSTCREIVGETLARKCPASD